MIKRNIRERSRKWGLRLVGEWFDRNDLIYSIFDRWEFARKISEIERDVDIINNSRYRGNFLYQILITDFLSNFCINSITRVGYFRYPIFKEKLTDEEKRKIYSTYE